MKRLCCILLALFLLLGYALGEEDWYDPDDFGDDWTYLESRFGYSLWYPEDMLSFWTEDFADEMAEWFCPWEDESGVAAMICRGSRFSAALWDECTRIDLDDAEIWLDYPYEMTAYTDGETISEQWIISAPERDYVFIIQYEEGDFQGWAPLMREVLTTLEFPNQPAENESFRLDFFQGGAAGMRFIDVVVDADAEPIVLMPLEDVTDFVLEAVEWENFEDTAAPICFADSLSPGQNLRIYVYIPDMLPNLRFRYKDARGEEQCWYISQSGRDGSLLMIGLDDL